MQIFEEGFRWVPIDRTERTMGSILFYSCLLIPLWIMCLVPLPGASTLEFVIGMIIVSCFVRRRYEIRSRRYTVDMRADRVYQLRREIRALEEKKRTLEKVHAENEIKLKRSRMDGAPTGSELQ